MILVSTYFTKTTLIGHHINVYFCRFFLDFFGAVHLDKNVKIVGYFFWQSAL